MDFLSLVEDQSEDMSWSVSETPLPDYHLRNPIKNLTWWDKEHLPFRQRKDRQDIIQKHGHAIEIGNPIGLFIDHWHRIPAQDHIPFCTAVGDVRWKLKMDNSIMPPSSRIPLISVIENVSKLPNVYWNGMRYWNHVLLVLNALSSNRRTPSGESSVPVRVPLIGDSYVDVFRTCCVVCTLAKKKKTVTLYDGDWIRMTSDLYTQRWLVLISSAVGETLNAEHYPMARYISAIYEWGDSVIRRHGNEGYKVIKVYEAVMVGVLQSRGASEIAPPGRFLNNTLKDLRDTSLIFLEEVKKLIDIVKDLENGHHLTQLYGLHRSWGHPAVDSAEGMMKLMKIGRKDIIKDNSLSINAGRMFKVLFCREFRNKTGSYPPVVSSPTLLCTEIEEGDPNAISLKMHTLKEWDRVKFKQIFKLPETFNLSMIVADKAISPTISELRTIVRERGTVMDPDKRRGVKRWLNDKSLDPILFLKDINDGKFDKDHLIIGLTPKERELNPVPRMFSLMSHLLRVYVVVTEQMLSDHVLPMFPQITMTDTLLDLTRKMYSTVKGQSSVRKRHSREGGWCSRTVCASLDFEKWNGHMRKSMTHGVFTAIGELFGLADLYNMTYDLFSQSFYYLADGSYVPQFDENGQPVVQEPQSFINHQGGMEGLRQKGWTLYTVCGLEVILSRYDCEYKIMGMGDNQVLQITVYTKNITEMGTPSHAGIEEMRINLENIFKDLITSFTESGLPLKPLETWVSEDLFLYGKVPIWKGVPLTMDLKRLMRTFPMSNEGVMTLENALSTVASNSLSATQSSPCIWTAYVIYNLMTSLCVSDFMKYHPILGSGMNMIPKDHKGWGMILRDKTRIFYDTTKCHIPTDYLRRLIMIIPKCLGGYSGANMYEMMVRGFSDHLSRDVSYMCNLLLSSVTPRWVKDHIRKWLRPIYMPSKNYAMLLEDITAVNLLSPRSPLSGVRQLVSKFLSTGMKITNPEFLQLVKVSRMDDRQFLAECLCEGDELHLRLLHDIFDATIYGYVDSILSKVTKTSTIQKLAISSDSGRVFETIMKDEINFFNFFRWRNHNQGEEISSSCATTICKIMREKGWGKTVRGITIPFPMSFMIETNCSPMRGCDCSDGFVSVHLPDRQLDNASWDNDIGANPPYLGSMTKEKVIIGTGGKVYSGEPLVRRPINLLKTINWFVPKESNTAEIIKGCACAVTDLELDRFMGMSEGSAGTEIHRYNDSMTFRGALTSSNFLYSTRYHISTDEFVRYAKGSENTDIHFQALFCCIVELTNMYISKQLRDGEAVTRFKHFKQCCYECVQPIEEDFIDLPSSKALSVLPSFKGNQYLYTPSERIRIAERISPLFNAAEETMTIEQYEMLSPRQKLMMLQDSICDRIVSDIMKGKSDGTHVAASLLSTKAYERTMYLKFSARYLLDNVMGNLRKAAGCTILRSHPDRFGYKEEEEDRVLENMISSADNDSFLGLAMFYCWNDTAAEMGKTYPELVYPSTNPISVSSACYTIQTNMLALIRRKIKVGRRRSKVILDDEKNNTWVYRRLLIEEYERKSLCKSCVAQVYKLESYNLLREFKLAKCQYNHMVSDAITRYPWIKSYVTIERLRKDCDSNRDSIEESNNPLGLIPLSENFNEELISCSSLRIRPEVGEYMEPNKSAYAYFQSSGVNPFTLICVYNMPTATVYKIQSIMQDLRHMTEGKEVLCIGDGLGLSSSTILSMGARRVVSSTLLEPDNAIPHSFSHNMLPAKTIYCTKSIEEHQSIRLNNDASCATWKQEWDGVLKTIDVIYSDAEIINPDEHEARQKLFKNICCSGKRDLIVIKDYLWYIEELANRLGILSKLRCDRWLLRTTKVRSSRYPEVWWIIIGTEEQANIVFSAPHLENIYPAWSDIVSTLERVINDADVTDADSQLAARMTPGIGLYKMRTYLDEWCVFPIVGKILPKNGNFTPLFLYLTKTKRPRHVQDQTFSSQLKLYDSDYLKLRTRIFAMAVAMNGDLKEQRVMIESSKLWHLKWKRVSDQWTVYLKRGNTYEPECDVVKYIPILSLIMMEQQLKFEGYDDEIHFGYQSKHPRRKIYFPISKSSHISILDKEKKNQKARGKKTYQQH
uniref:Replicase n=1 Tax=Kenyan potato cytorhabdovirus TaxID=2801326 RepID=A0A7T7JPK1_9RHAB|nr:RNA-dependent RNA polymerase [Kenyan potato cytorhabdovirus]